MIKLVRLFLLKFSIYLLLFTNPKLPPVEVDSLYKVSDGLGELDPPIFLL